MYFAGPSVAVSTGFSPSSVTIHHDRTALSIDTSTEHGEICSFAFDQAHSPGSPWRLALFHGRCSKARRISLYHITGADETEQIASFIPPSHFGAAIQSAFHSDLLVALTCTPNFQLQLYHVSGTHIELIRTLSSFTSFPPCGLTLCRLPTSHKILISHAVPIYPAPNWSIASTEVSIERADRGNISARTFRVFHPDWADTITGEGGLRGQNELCLRDPFRRSMDRCGTPRR